jgi:hypothetical protein
MGCWLECERHGLGIRSDTDMKPWCLGGDATALSLLLQCFAKRESNAAAGGNRATGPCYLSELPAVNRGGVRLAWVSKWAASRLRPQVQPLEATARNGFRSHFRPMPSVP